MIVAVHRNFRLGQLLVLTYENKLIQRIQIGADDTKATHTVIRTTALFCCFVILKCNFVLLRSFLGHSKSFGSPKVYFFSWN